MVTIYVATTNVGKLRDFRFAGEQAASDIQLEPLPKLENFPRRGRWDF